MLNRRLVVRAAQSLNPLSPLQDPLIGETLNSFITEITNTMSAEYREFYNREFNFFNTVTEISSIIKPFPKGPERRAECLRALKQITINRYNNICKNREMVKEGRAWHRIHRLIKFI